MAYDAGLAARVDDALHTLGERGARQKNVFGGRGFLLGTRTFAIVFGDDLIVKVPKADYAAALAEPGVTPFAPDGERPMGSWVVVTAEQLADDPQLQEWLERGRRALR